MKLADIAPATGLKKASSGLADPNKSAHAMKKILKEKKTNKDMPMGSPVIVAERKEELTRKVVKKGVVVEEEAPKRFTVNDFISNHLS